MDRELVVYLYLGHSVQSRLIYTINGLAYEQYDDLAKKASSASGDFSALTAKIKAAEKRLSEISKLQKQIGVNNRTRDIYTQYRKSGCNSNYFEEHRANIMLHRAAKKHFDSIGIKKLPTIASLKQEYAALLAEKKKLYSGYHTVKSNMQELLAAKGNAQRVLGIKDNGQERDISRGQNKSNPPDR